MLRLIMTALLCASLWAEAPQYITGADTDLTTTARNLVLKQAASPSRSIVLQYATVYSENDAVVTVTRNANVSSGTAETVQGLPGVRTATATAVRQATVTGGTAYEPDFVQAGSTIVLSLDGQVLYGTSDDITISTDAISGRVVIRFYSVERNR